MILLQEKKTAIFDIDYSKLVVTEGKNHDNLLFYFRNG